jgi:membrane protein DedA with SNARE-associated domain
MPIMSLLDVTHLMNTVKPYIEQYGYWAVFGSILLEDFGLPTPGEAMLIAGALLASHGDLYIIPLLITAWIAAVVGDNIGYAIGRFGGRPLVLRYGRYVFINQRRLGHAETFFGKHGGIVVVSARFIEGLRQLNGIVAGLAKMSWWRFLTYNALGAALWVGFWGMLFYHIGEGASRFADVFKRFEFIFLGGLLILAVGLGIYHWRRHK